MEGPREPANRGQVQSIAGRFEGEFGEGFGVKNGGEMKLNIGGSCGLALEKMLVRVDKNFKLEVHIDTDEGNACNLQPDTPCDLIK